MRFFSLRSKRQGQAPISFVPVELLESRQLLSVSGGIAMDVAPSPVVAVTVTAAAGTPFKNVVGTWTNADGLPKAGSGIGAVAIVHWGDGRASRAKLVDDGSGTIQIVGTHTWAKPGTFATTVDVTEFPRRHPRQITEIGQATGQADITPHPHAISLKGSFTGTYTNPFGNPEVRTYDFTGTGTTRTTGAADLAGSISPPGFIRTGAAHGTFTLTATAAGVTGTVTFDVTGHTQTGGSGLPQKLAYVITDATGDFANARGKGTISVAVDTNAGTFVLVIH